MIKYKVFVGTIAEIERDFNAWASALADGVNVNAGPLMALNPQSVEEVAARQWTKEVMYVVPKIPAGKIAIPQMQHQAN